MPSYHAADLTVRLAVSPLSATLSADPAKSNNPVAKYNIYIAEIELKKAKPLKESPVNWLAGDDGELVGGGEDQRLGFLGAYGEVPFLCVGVDVGKAECHVVDEVKEKEETEVRGKHPALYSQQESDDTSLDVSLSDLTGLGPSSYEMGERSDSPKTKSTGKDESPMRKGLIKLKIGPHKRQKLAHDGTPPSMPKPTGSSPKTPPSAPSTELLRALTLAIDLNEKSLNRSEDSRSRAQDLKIETFLNGQLTNSTCIQSRQIAQTPDVHLRLSGTRIGRILERAWVLRPDAGFYRDETTRNSSVECDQDELRWKAINEALLSQASIGTTRNGKKPPSTEYLESLATMKTPNVILEKKTSARPSFAVVDVIFTLGHGKKFATEMGYMFAVERFLDPKLSTLWNTPKKTSPPAKVMSTKDSAVSERSPIMTRSRTTQSPEKDQENISMNPGSVSLGDNVPVLTSTSATSAPFARTFAGHDTEAAAAKSSWAGRRTRGVISTRQPKRTSGGLFTKDLSKATLEGFHDDYVRAVTASTTKPATDVDSWSYRSRSGAKTPVIERTVTDSGKKPSGASARSSGKADVVVMIPHRSEEDSRAKWPKVGDSLRSAVSISPSPMPRNQTAYSTFTASQPRTKPQFPAIISNQTPVETSNIIQPIGNTNLNSAIKKTATALREGVKPKGALMSAIACDVEKDGNSIPSVGANDKSTTVIYWTAQPDLDNFTSVVVPPQQPSQLRIGIANGKAAIYPVAPAYAEPIVTPGNTNPTTVDFKAFGMAVSNLPLPNLEFVLPRKALLAVSTSDNDVTPQSATVHDEKASASVRGTPRGRGRGRPRGRGGRAVDAAEPRSSPSISKRKRDASVQIPATTPSTPARRPGILKLTSGNAQASSMPTANLTSAINTAIRPAGETTMPSESTAWELHDGSLVGYLEPQDYASLDLGWRTRRIGMTPGELTNFGVRQVRAERGSVFEETECLVGMRFLVVCGDGGGGGSGSVGGGGFGDGAGYGAGDEAAVGKGMGMEEV